jgi:hypothetical protein
MRITALIGLAVLGLLPMADRKLKARRAALPQPPRPFGIDHEPRSGRRIRHGSRSD